MRNDTLLGLSFVLSIAIFYTLREVSGYTGLSSWVAWFGAFLFAIVLGIILAPINKKILKWRKERGRDIEEEQRYETEDGFISLTRRDDEN